MPFRKLSRLDRLRRSLEIVPTAAKSTATARIQKRDLSMPPVKEIVLSSENNPAKLGKYRKRFGR